MPRWRVDIIRRRAEHLGTVEATNEKDAIQLAIGRFEVPAALRNRLIVSKQREPRRNK